MTTAYRYGYSCVMLMFGSTKFSKLEFTQLGSQQIATRKLTKGIVKQAETARHVPAEQPVHWQALGVRVESSSGGASFQKAAPTPGCLFFRSNNNQYMAAEQPPAKKQKAAATEATTARWRLDGHKILVTGGAHQHAVPSVHHL